MKFNLTSLSEYVRKKNVFQTTFVCVFVYLFLIIITLWTVYDHYQMWFGKKSAVLSGGGGGKLSNVYTWEQNLTQLPPFKEYFHPCAMWEPSHVNIYSHKFWLHLVTVLCIDQQVSYNKPVVHNNVVKALSHVPLLPEESGQLKLYSIGYFLCQLPAWSGSRQCHQLQWTCNTLQGYRRNARLLTLHLQPLETVESMAAADVLQSSTY